MSSALSSLTTAAGHARLVFVGHRGVGQNRPPPVATAATEAASVATGTSRVSPDIRENTVLSINRAAKLGVDFVEFDVQVTKDGIPVIFHDNHILTADGLDCKISDLTLAEFQSIGPSKTPGEMGRQLIRRRKDGNTYTWVAEEEDAMPTLVDLFDCVDPRIGFNVEVKFAADDSKDAGGPEEIDRILSALLPVVDSHCGSRPLFFSSFMPDAVVALRKRQTKHEVLFLTVGSGSFSDDRMNSVQAAVAHCKAHALSGIVSEVKTLLADSATIRLVKDAGLLLYSYGTTNDDVDAAHFQQYHGVDGIIVDDVAAMSDHVLNVTPEDLQPPFGRYGV
ncbi:hypothetical protein CLOM_g20268 [Closterium sp. NIES-68]|nr:hypothetical protein CLOM_g20268 [Closterium sp. NIES-68]GJP64359.1 hypothetical protein CLOP_g21363 [Closterium sp. NIES-67]